MNENQTTVHQTNRVQNGNALSNTNKVFCSTCTLGKICKKWSILRLCVQFWRAFNLIVRKDQRFFFKFILICFSKKSWKISLDQDKFEKKT